MTKTTEKFCAMCTHWELGERDGLTGQIVIRKPKDGFSIGTCHVRSVPDSDFPKRWANEWCSADYKRKEEIKGYDQIRDLVTN